MKLQNPILSILITTYERASELQNCLESFNRLNPRELSLIEFVVLDNGSGDNTRDLLDLATKVLPLRYLSVEENIGFDRAILLLNSEANGKYIWFFGDRYSLTDIGIRTFRRLIDWISEEQPDVITFQSKLLTLPNKLGKTPNSSHIIEVNSQQLCQIVHFDSLPSSITKKEMDSGVDSEQLEEFIGSEFMQVALNFSKVSKLKLVKLGIFPDESGFYSNSASATSGFRFSTFGMLNGKRKIHAKFPEFSRNPLSTEEIGFILHEKLGKSKLYGLPSDVNNYSDFTSIISDLNLRLSLKDRVIALIYAYIPAWILKKILGNLSKD